MPSSPDTAAQPVCGTWRSQDLELNYLDWGNQDAEPLLLVHGMWDHARSWDRVAEDFAIDLAHYWREITAPTLLCRGPESWTSDPATDGSAACFRNASTLTFERSGHWIHHEQFGKFIEAVSRFLPDPTRRGGRPA